MKEDRLLWELVPAPGKTASRADVPTRLGRLVGIAGGECSHHRSTRKVTRRVTLSDSRDASADSSPFNRRDLTLYGSARPANTSSP
ncbi:hypothetical protein GCM10020220_090170 [Nonomuraea rubra]